MVHTGWSLPAWTGTPPLTARWVGLDAFLRDAPWAPFPSARAYDLPPFTEPDGRPAADLYAVLSHRDWDGHWRFELESSPRIDDDQARRSGLSELAERQSGPPDVQGKTGWPIVRLIHLDFANPQMAAYCRRETERIVAALHPDGLHADNLGDNGLGDGHTGAFGAWSVHTFRDRLRRTFSPEELRAMGVADPASFDIAAYLRDKPLESRGRPWHPQNHAWLDDPIWSAYRVHKIEAALAYHRSWYATAKAAAATAGLDCAVFGNTIPMPLGGALMRGACDIPHFEWSAAHPWWGMRPMGLPPTGRVDYVTRLGAAISDAGYCWPSLYVPRTLAGTGHENLHKVVAFDALANRGLMDFGHGYRDGYSPGTPSSAGVVNRFVREHAAILSGRRYAADIAVAHSAWSEIASCTVFNPVPDLFIDEYCGWCRFLSDTHRQWDVVVQADMTADALARFPVVVLPSVLSLSDREIEELRRYVAGGGRLVATGLTGARHGPDRLFARRAAASEIPGATVTTDRPGVDYWRRGRDPETARIMAELLAAAGSPRGLETDAPPTVGVNLNVGEEGGEPYLTLDFNNVDIDVATDAIRPAPDVAVTFSLPAAWPSRGLQVDVLRPGEPPMPLPPEALRLDSAVRKVRLTAPPFEVFQILWIRPAAAPPGVRSRAGTLTAR